MDTPVCGNCKVEMRCMKTGFTVANKAVPHYVRSGDLFICPRCDNKTVVNLGEPYDSKKAADLYFE